MPALPNVNKVVRTSMVFTYGDDLDVITRFFFRYTGSAPTAAELSTFNANAGGSFSGDLAAIASTFVTATGAESTDLTSPSSAQSIDTFDFPGTRAGTKLPASSSAVVGYEIGRRYRGGHSRGYWPFGVEADLATPQTWAGAFVSAFQGGVDNFFADLLGSVWAGGGVFTQVNVSYYSGFHVVTNPSTGRARNVPTLRGVPVVDDINTRTGRARVGSQRRRLG